MQHVSAVMRKQTAFDMTVTINIEDAFNKFYIAVLKDMIVFVANASYTFALEVIRSKNILLF